jgi:hypothetical protein
MNLGKDQEKSSYGVEVSGWDASDHFFVEKTMLQWAGDERKEIGLRSLVGEGRVVFLRTLQPMDDVDNFPIACQVVKVMETDANGRTPVQVVQLRPRAFFKEIARELNGSAIKVA